MLEKASRLIDLLLNFTTGKLVQTIVEIKNEDFKVTQHSHYLIT